MGGGAVLYPLGTWGLYVLLVRFGVSLAEWGARVRAKAARSEEIAAEFSGEIASWERESARRHPPLVRRIRQELEPPPTAPAALTSRAGPEEIAADPTRRALLVARLKEHAKLLKDSSDNSDLTWVGLVCLWLFVTPVLGAVCSTIVYLWDAEGREKSTMYLLGIIGGCLAAWASWWAMAAARRRLVRTREAGLDRFMTDAYPKAGGEWGGPRHAGEPGGGRGPAEDDRPGGRVGPAGVLPPAARRLTGPHLRDRWVVDQVPGKE